MAERYFRARSTTFHCRSCGRLTRDTTGTSQELCPQCDAWTMIENSICDDDLAGTELAAAEARITKLKAEAVKKGGRFSEPTNTATTAAQAHASLLQALTKRPSADNLHKAGVIDIGVSSQTFLAQMKADKP